MQAQSSAVLTNRWRANGQSEASNAYLRELAQVQGWRIWRCDTFHLLLLDTLNENNRSSRSHVIVFTPHEYRMLIPLLERLGQPLPFVALLNGPVDISRDRDLFRIHMSRVRKKIAHLGVVIRRVKGYGYLAQVE